MMSYSAYDIDCLKVAKEVKIEHTIYEDICPGGIDDLIVVPLADITDARADSAAAEQEVYERMRELAKKWEKQAGVTMRYDAAIDYLSTPPAEHTSNQWEQPDSYSRRYIRSNAVYRMSYSIYENTKYDLELQKSIPVSWTLSWNIFTNAPKTFHQMKIAGQDRKVFPTMEALDKYLAGRIKAYQHLFNDIYPDVPPECADCFKVHGTLLPGYKIAK